MQVIAAGVVSWGPQDFVSRRSSASGDKQRAQRCCYRNGKTGCPRHISLVIHLFRIFRIKVSALGTSEACSLRLSLDCVLRLSSHRCSYWTRAMAEQTQGETSMSRSRPLNISWALCSRGRFASPSSLLCHGARLTMPAISPEDLKISRGRQGSHPCYQRY